MVLEQQYKPKIQKKGHEAAHDMTTVELSEYQNFAIQHAVISEEDDEEESKENLLSSQHAPNQKERIPDRISCTYRELARYQRQQLGIVVGTDSKASDNNSDLNNSIDSGS